MSEGILLRLRDYVFVACCPRQPQICGAIHGAHIAIQSSLHQYTNISRIHILRLLFGDLRSDGSCSNLRPSVKVPALSPRCKDSTSPPWILPVVWFVLFPIQPPFRDRFGCGNDCFVEGGGDLFSVDSLLCQNIQQWLRGKVFSFIQCVVLCQLFSIIY